MVTRFPTDYTGDKAVFVIDSGRLRTVVVAVPKVMPIVGTAIDPAGVTGWQAMKLTGNINVLPGTVAAGIWQMSVAVITPFHATYLDFNINAGVGWYRINYPGGSQTVNGISLADMKTGYDFELRMWVSGGIWYTRIICGPTDSGDISTALAYPANTFAANPLSLGSTFSANAATKGISVDNLKIYPSV